MSVIPTTCTFYEYRSERYEALSGGKDFARLRITRDTDHSVFPDALEFGHSRGQYWVTVPRCSISQRFRRRVTGRWRGAEVDVWGIHTSGWDEGKVTLAYEGSSPEQALALGFTGDQYMGWYVAADPAEVEVTDVTITERPLKAGS